jgi:penicillin-binding protein 1A
MWMQYMGKALAGTPNLKREQPEGLVTVRIDPATGLLAGSARAGGVFETFRTEFIPEKTGETAVSGTAVGAGGDTPEQLF